MHMTYDNEPHCSVKPRLWKPETNRDTAEHGILPLDFVEPAAGVLGGRHGRCRGTSRQATLRGASDPDQPLESDSLFLECSCKQLFQVGLCNKVVRQDLVLH